MSGQMYKLFKITDTMSTNFQKIKYADWNRMQGKQFSFEEIR